MRTLFLHGPMIWNVMQRSAWKDTVSWRIKQRNNYTKSQRHALRTTNFSKEEMESVGELSTVCSHIVLKCLYLDRVGGPDILWSVNKHARAVTKWTKACGERSARLISYIHHTCEFRHYCYVGYTAQQCRLGLFQGSDFCRRPWRLEIDIRWTPVHFRKPNICANKLDVQETDLSLTQFNGSWDFSWRRFTHGWISALELWVFVIEVFHSSPNQANKARDLAELQGKLVAEHNAQHAKSNFNQAHQSRSEPKRWAKRMQEQKEEEINVAKSKPTAMNLTWKKSSRSYERFTAEVQRMTWTTSTWTPLYGVYSWTSRFKQQFILVETIWRSFTFYQESTPEICETVMPSDWKVDRGSE